MMGRSLGVFSQNDERFKAKQNSEKAINLIVIQYLRITVIKITQ